MMIDDTTQKSSTPPTPNSIIIPHREIEGPSHHPSAKCQTISPPSLSSPPSSSPSSLSPSLSLHPLLSTVTPMAALSPTPTAHGLTVLHVMPSTLPPLPPNKTFSTPSLSPLATISKQKSSPSSLTPSPSSLVLP